MIGGHNLIKERIGQIDYAVGQGKSLESFLSALSKDLTETTQVQLIEIQQYLHDLFRAICGGYFKPEFKNTSPYYSFLRELKKTYNSASIVTFNYDLFLDEAMEEIFKYKYLDIKSYYNKDYELYKVHGSINWTYLFGLTGSEDFGSSEKVAKFIIEAKKHYKSLHPHLIVKGIDYSRHHMVPALAIPLPDNKQFIVSEHKERLITNLKQADKVIIIGWSASDEYFVKEIMENLDYSKAKLIIVSPKSGQLIKERLTPKRGSELTGMTTKVWQYEPKIVSKTFSRLVNEYGALEEIFGL